MDKLSLYIKKLTIKNVKLQEILVYVSSKNFKISEEEIGHIENYLAKKDRLCKELIILEEDIKKIEVSKIEKEDKNVLKIVVENDDTIKRILEIDEKNKTKLDEIYKLIKANIKSIKSLEKANKTYFGAYETNFGGNYFDSMS